ncbi:MAG: hypothetical protein ACRCU2_03110 [Planktothrix sp.]
MSDYISQLIEGYKTRGILIDTNILLLWCVGTVNRQRISKFNQTEKFLPENYETLLRTLSMFTTIGSPNDTAR